MTANQFSFWHWFFQSSGGKPGYRRLINKWILFHGAVGVTIAFLVCDELATAANTVLLPLAGILVGLSFAWAGNAQALMQSEEINQLADHRKGGFVEYVYAYQTAILTILVTLVFWGMAGLHIFDSRWPTSKETTWYFTIKSFLFCLSSMTLRECWHVVMGAQWMLIAQREIKKRASKENK